MDEPTRNKDAKDRATMEAIGCIYCRGNHDSAIRGADGMCPECRNAIEATLERAAACPYGHESNCEDCRTHCQRGEAQQEIKRIMRYAAPRMVVRHPLMTATYLKRKLRSKAR